MIDGCPVEETNRLKMTRPRFRAIKSTPASRLVLIFPVGGLNVKGIGPSPLEIGVRSREEEPAGTTDRTVITTTFGHNLNTRL